MAPMVTGVFPTPYCEKSSTSSHGELRQRVPLTDTLNHPQKYTASPWVGSWNLLVANPRTSLSYRSAPVSVIYRGHDVAQNFSRLVALRQYRFAGLLGYFG